MKVRELKTRTAACAMLALLVCSGAWAQSPKEIVQKAVQSELEHDRSDHSKWLFHETNKQPGKHVVQWVAQAVGATVKRVIEKNGTPVPLEQQRQQVEAFVHNSSAQAQQSQSERHDDRQATALLKMLPEGFDWKVVNDSEKETELAFQPNPNFRPPTREAKVFSAMAGGMVVSKPDYRIQSLHGKLIRDVTFGWWGVLGRLNAGGTFDVERRETGEGIWQITETHVHINGHALLFKTISEEEDDVKTDFKRLPDDIDVKQAAQEAMQQPATASQ